jgi:hypothetical protein
MDMNSDQEEEHEDIMKILSALIILNSPMERPPSAIFGKLWAISSFRDCTDGVANCRYHTKDNDNNENSSCSSDSGKINNYITDLIRGGLDPL